MTAGVGPGSYAYVLGNPLRYVDPFGLDAITSDPNVRECLCRLWRKAGYGFHPQERAAWILKNEDVYSCMNWPWSAQSKKETWKGPIPEGAVGIGHTHPTRYSQSRASPRPSSGDCKTAEKINMPVYVVSDDGVWKCSPCGTKSHEEKEDPTTWCSE